MSSGFSLWEMFTIQALFVGPILLVLIVGVFVTKLVNVLIFGGSVIVNWSYLALLLVAGVTLTALGVLSFNRDFPKRKEIQP